MIYYHGTLARFQRINVKYGTHDKDFGQGFYLSDSIKHARSIIEWHARNHGDNPARGVIYIYDINIQELVKQGLSCSFN